MTPKGYYNVYTNGNEEMAFHPPQSQQSVVSSEPLYTEAQVRELMVSAILDAIKESIRNYAQHHPTE